jgi:hypothetical protein
VVTVTGTGTTVSALCPTGKVAMGGGYSGLLTGSSNQVTASRPATAGLQTGWQVTQTREVPITVHVTCIQ